MFLAVHLETHLAKPTIERLVSPPLTRQPAARHSAISIPGITRITRFSRASSFAHYAAGPTASSNGIVFRRYWSIGARGSSTTCAGPLTGCGVGMSGRRHGRRIAMSDWPLIWRS